MSPYITKSMIWAASGGVFALIFHMCGSDPLAYTAIAFGGIGGFVQLMREIW